MSCLVVITLLAMDASAQSGIDLHAFAPVSTSAEPGEMHRVWQPRSFETGQWGASMLYDYAEWSLYRYFVAEPDEIITEPVIDYLNTANLSAFAGLGPRLAIGLSAPLYVSAIHADGKTNRGLGDVRVALPYSLLASDGGAGLGVSVVPTLDIPTGNNELNLGSGVVRAGGLLALGYDERSNATESTRGDWSLAMNVGAMGSPASADTPGGATRMVGSVGGSYLVQDSLALALEATTDPSLGDAVPEGLDKPKELLLSARGAGGSGLGWMVGYARTLSADNSAPLYRGLAGLNWSPVSEEVEPAPPPAARTTAPVRLSVLDSKGVPVIAEVQLDGETSLPAVELGESGSIEQELAFGPWRALVSAPDYGLTMTRFVVKEDQEGLLEIQIILHQARVRLEEDELVILEKVHFDVDKDQVKPESLPLLQEVAAILLTHTEIQSMEIQGHTDDQGDLAYNLELSQRRVESVRNLLIVQGVEADRLQAKGYGESRPIAEGTSEDARAANRRVQFLILETSD